MAYRELLEREAHVARTPALEVELDFGPIRRTSAEVMRALKREGIPLNTVGVEQIAAKHGIELRDTGRCRS